MLAPTTRVLLSYLRLKGRWCILNEGRMFMIALVSLVLLFLLGARANEIGRIVRVHVPRHVIRLEST